MLEMFIVPNLWSGGTKYLVKNIKGASGVWASLLGRAPGIAMSS